MYLGNIKNLSDDINLSDTTINMLSDFEFVKKCFEDNFNFNKHDFKSNNITSSLNDIVYLEENAVCILGYS